MTSVLKSLKIYSFIFNYRAHCSNEVIGSQEKVYPSNLNHTFHPSQIITMLTIKRALSTCPVYSFRYDFYIFSQVQGYNIKGTLNLVSSWMSFTGSVYSLKLYIKSCVHEY